MKIAYCAGHYLGTPGKKVPKALDPNQTREWVLNDRVADYFEQAAQEYKDVELLRTDDPTGKKHISIKNRTKKANKWGADFYADMHHNAGINLGYGGGVVAISGKNDVVGAEYRDAIYAAVVEAGGLAGNRSNPTYAKNYNTMVYADMPAVIIEYGFMDSRTDYPIISSDWYPKAVAYATMAAIAKVAGLKKKSEVQPENDNTMEVDFTVEMRLLKKGCKGEDVRALQILLKGRGYDCGSADGIFGGKTDAAVRKYQKDNNLTQDGIAGEDTMSSLLGVA